jgi:hypothetical protein
VVDINMKAEAAVDAGERHDRRATDRIEVSK